MAYSASFPTYLISDEEKKFNSDRSIGRESSKNRGNKGDDCVLRYSLNIPSSPPANLSGWFDRQKSLWYNRRWLELRGHSLYYRHSRHSQAQWVVDVRECDITAGVHEKELILKKPKSDTKIILYAPNIDEFKLWFSELKRASDNIFQFYHLSIKVSHVKFGCIFLGRDKKCISTSHEQSKVSVFRYDKGRVPNAFIHNIQNKNLRALKIIQDHPGLLSVFDIFETSHHLYLVTEAIFGNTLYDIFIDNEQNEFIYIAPYSFDRQFKFKNQPSLSSTVTSSTSSTLTATPSLTVQQDVSVMSLKVGEKELCRLAYDVLTALEYMHSKKLVHGRLDLNQIILTKRITPSVKFEGIQIRVICYENLPPPKDDMGLKKDYGPVDEWTKAPEIVCFNNYTTKSDIFAVGVILFQLLTGEYPFRVNVKKDEYLSSVSRGPYGEIWNDLPAPIKSILKTMLQDKKEYRPSAKMCLLHEWFTDLPDVPKETGKYWTEDIAELFECPNKNDHVDLSTLPSDFSTSTNSDDFTNTVGQVEVATVHGIEKDTTASEINDIFKE